MIILLLQTFICHTLNIKKAVCELNFPIIPSIADAVEDLWKAQIFEQETHGASGGGCECVCEFEM